MAMASTSLGQHQESRSQVTVEKMQSHTIPQRPTLIPYHTPTTTPGVPNLWPQPTLHSPQPSFIASLQMPIAKLHLSTHIPPTAPYSCLQTASPLLPRETPRDAQSCSVLPLPASAHDCTLSKGVGKACRDPEHHSVALSKVTDLLLLHIHILDVS